MSILYLTEADVTRLLDIRLAIDVVEEAFQRLAAAEASEACRHEAGDFMDALQKGVFDWSRAVDLAEVVAGRAVGRSRAESLTLFKSVGLAVEDVALGGKLIELARRDGVGRTVML